MCCLMCYFNHLHDDHRVIEIKNIDLLHKENITLENELKELNNNSDEIIKLKNKIEEEINKINKLYEDLIKQLENSYLKKYETILKEKNELIEKLKLKLQKLKKIWKNIYLILIMKY